MKACVETHRNVRHKALDLPKAIVNTLPVNLTTDASLTGASGVLSQGADPKTADIVAFWSGKFNSAQQNYPVHEQELLAIVKSLKRFRHLLIGLRFQIFTDHKGLEWISTQSKLSPRQARWLEALSEFDFEITYLLGTDNVLADALSQMYSNEPKGTIRAASEYVSVKEDNVPNVLLLHFVTVPVYTGSPLFLGMTEAQRSACIARQWVTDDGGNVNHSVDQQNSDASASAVLDAPTAPDNVPVQRHVQPKPSQLDDLPAAKV